MTEGLMIALMGFSGTTLGTFGGILVANKLSNYRIKQLEIKVDKHNNFAARMPVIEEQIKEIKEDIQEIKGR